MKRWERIAKKRIPAWWELAATGQERCENVTEFTTRWAMSRLVELAVIAGVRVEDQAASGTVENFEALADALKASGGRLLAHLSPPDDEDSIHSSARVSIFVGPHACVRISRLGETGRTRVDVTALGGVSEAIWDVIRAYLVPRIAADEDADVRPVFFLSSGIRGMSFVPVGGIGEPLSRENYADDVLAQFDGIAKNIVAKHPRGRLVLISGPPGTGKTHLVRGLIHAVPDAMFVMVDADIISSLTKPGMLPVLLSEREENSDMPFVFVVEDGDAAVAQRGLDNLAHIQTLLNIGSGLAGDMLNVHVVVTTNAHSGSGKLDVDAALERKGRLAARFAILPMPRDRARAAFSRLVPGGDLDAFLPPGTTRDAPVTLANVYEAAAVAGWQETKPRAVAPSTRPRNRAVKIR